MQKVLLAVLAHESRRCLADLLANARAFVDPVDIVVYNGGPHPGLLDGLDATPCPGAVRLYRGNLVPFHAAVMRFAESRGIGYDHLITLDSDMLFVKQGVAAFLDGVMGDTEFMAAGYLRSDDWCRERMPRLRRFEASWPLWWRRVFGDTPASWAHNPGMVFRRSAVQRIVAWPELDRMLRISGRSRLHGVEEFVYPTIADRLGCRPLRHPEQSGNHPEPVDIPALHEYLASPSCYWIHKVPLDIGDPVRKEVRELQEGRAPARSADPVRPSVRPLAAPAPSSGARDRLKDLYFRLLP